MSDDTPIIFDSEATIVQEVGELAIKRQQFIPRSFIDDIRKEREDSITTPAGDTLYRVARIPTQIIDRWHREGFDYVRAPVREILRKLAKDQEEHWITTKKRI
jgi:hypothetical protein